MIGAWFAPYVRKLGNHLDAPDRILGDVGHVESPFGPFGHSVSFGA
jgi:hypothetical protein